MSGNDSNVEIHIKADAGGVEPAARKTVAELEAIRKATNEMRVANAASSQAAKEYVAALEREAAQLGMTATQKRVYEAAAKGASKADQEAVRALSENIEAHGQMEKVATNLGRAVAVTAGVIAYKFVQALKDSVVAARESEQAMLRLDAVYKASGGASGMTRGELEGLADNMKTRTGFDDDKIRESMALLLTFRNVGRESFGGVMSTAADLSRVMRQDLNSSVMMLGKALENPEHGLTALSRAGVSFSDAQKQTIKDMVGMGRQAEAMNLILNTLREQGINGAAEAMNTGLFKATNDLTMAWGDLLKAIGGTAVVKGTVETVFGSLSNYLGDMKRIVNDGDWLDRLAFFTIGMTTPSMQEGKQWEGSVGGTEARKAREAQNAQADQRRADQQTNFLRQFETPEQKRDRELNNAAHLFAGSDKLQPALDAVQAKYAKKGGAAGRDVFADTVTEASGVNRNFATELGALKAGLDAGRISEEAYIGTVERLILKQPFATKELQETIKELALKERVLNKVDAAETAAREVLEKAGEAHTQRNEELRLEVELLGKNATERAKLTAYRKIDAQLAKDEARLTDRLGKIGDLDGIDAGVAQLRAGAAEAKAAWTEAHDTIETRQRSWLAGARDGLRAYADEAARSADAMASAFKRGAQMAEDALANFVVTGKLDIASLARYAATELARENFAKPIVSAGTNWLQGLFSPGYGDIAGVAAGVPQFAGGGDHAGGYRIVGENGPELEATGPSRIFNAGQARNMLSGGGVQVIVNDQRTAPTSSPVSIEQGSGADGMQRISVMIRDEVSGQLASGKHDAPLRARYGITPPTVKRG